MFQISLTAARVNAGLTQEEVARKVRKSKTTIANWEAGKTEIDQANLVYLCELYKVPIDLIFLPSNLSKKQV
jgi:transcriptional regulator with XRE-family HTH domain